MYVLVCVHAWSLAGNGDEGFVVKHGDGTAFGVGSSDRAAALAEAMAATGGGDTDITLVSVAARKRGKLPRT